MAFLFPELAELVDGVWAEAGVVIVGVRVDGGAAVSNFETEIDPAHELRGAVSDRLVEFDGDAFDPLAVAEPADVGPVGGDRIEAALDFVGEWHGGEVLQDERDFVTAAKALGGRDFYVLFRHVVPNTLASVTVIATFGMAIVIITEASLSFLGLGVPVHIPTWGSMLAEGRSYINRAPWLTIFPGLAIFITVFGINLLGDGLRDIFDPKLRRQR